MQEKKDTITNKWIDFETFLGSSAGTSTYRIYNRGNDAVLLQENTSKPSDSNDDGEPLLMNKYATFQKGTSNLYLRAQFSSSVINVVEVDNA
jgi:hypothetical protein